MKFIRPLLIMIIILAAAVPAMAVPQERLRAVELDPNNVAGRFNLGLAYYQEENYDNAVEQLKKTLEVNAGDRKNHDRVDFQAAQLLGIIYFNFRDDMNEALKYFSMAASMNPANGDNYYYMGLAYKKSGNNEEALKNYMKALKNNAGDISEVNFRTGQIYYEKKEYGPAMEYFEKVVVDKPDHVQAREYLGNIYDRRGNAEKAVENFQRVIKKDPGNLSAQYQLGINYFKQKEYDKMIEAYKKAITIDPSFADAHYNLGMAYYYRNMFEDAIAEFETAIKLNPNDASAYSLLAQAKTAACDYHMNRGTTFLTEEDYLQARNEFTAVLKITDGDRDARKYLERANSEIERLVPVKMETAAKAFERNDYGSAYNAWDWVLQARPGNATAAEGMAKIEKNMDELLAARSEKARNFEKNGKLAEAVAEYAEIVKMAPKPRKALYQEKLSSVMDAVKTKVNALLTAAEKAYAAKSYKTALAKYSEVLKYDASNSKALNGITKVNSRMTEDKEKYLKLAKQNRNSNREKALANYKKVMELDPENTEANKGIEDMTGSRSNVAIVAGKVKTLYYEGVDKYVNGDIETAIKLWQKVLTMDPGHVEAKKNIRRAEEKLAAIKNLGR
ncbi:MAG: tetratricopeptide repeat protein [Spirochaetia bacterium]|nr:tetratricopeptide repeat protein [Spirochaetia bacterium]